MKQKCIFSISDIDSGWFDMDFDINEKIINVTVSNLYNNDSPKELLVMLTDFLSAKNDVEYVLFDGEHDTSIVSLEKEILTVAYSTCGYVDRQNKGIYIDLRGNMTFDEVSNIIEIQNISFQIEIDVETFILSVYKAFSKYANNFVLYDKYEENWDYFPQKEWEAFKQYVKQKY